MSAITSKTQISYCPDLDLYHYVRGEGEGEETEEYFFNTERLKQVIDSYGVSGNQAEAELLSFVTGLARQYPHRVLTIGEDGKVALSPEKKPPVVTAEPV
jgi:hypothetical protein